MSHTPAAIRAHFERQRREHKARHRDIAEQLGLSEGALIAAHAGTEAQGARLQAIRLQPDWPTLIESLEPLGEVMALTRNVSCVHEKVGVYRQASHNQHVGLVLGGAIDLRVFYTQWAHGFAVHEQGEHGPQRSLQFFDAGGTAIHKVFLKPQSDVAAYEALVQRFAAATTERDPGVPAAATAAAEVETADAAINVTGFREAWRALRDTHEFFGLLKKFGVTRTQALRLGPPELVQPVDSDCVHEVLQAAVREAISIMVFVGNPGMIQIHTGPIHQVAPMGPWLNVMDPGFNLHLRTDHIAQAWVVRKPTTDGLVTSLELYDREGETIAMLFGERKPGQPELASWRALIDQLAREADTCTA
mgnify:CR=1 FL=1